LTAPLLAAIATLPFAAALPEPGLHGAAGPPPGRAALHASTGMAFLLPHVTLGARVGTGLGSYASARYRNLAFFGHKGELSAGLGVLASRRLVLGVATRTSLMTLRPGDGGVIGIQFSTVALGNDWEVGGDVVLTVLRPGNAGVTASAGPTWTLGGTRYTSFDDSRFEIAPAFRSIDLAVQGEWPLSPRTSLWLRLDGRVVLGEPIVPWGFVPTGSAGVAWLL
jgi:hypothetical protein